MERQSFVNRIFAYERVTKEWNEKHFTRRLYYIGFCVMGFLLPFFCFLLPIQSSYINDVIQITLVLLTFTIGIYSHEIRALREEKTQIFEHVTQLELKRKEKRILPTHAQIEIFIIFQSYEQQLRDNLLASTCLIPIAHLSILNYILTILFAIAAHLTNYNILFIQLALNFLTSGFTIFTLLGLPLEIFKRS